MCVDLRQTNGIIRTGRCVTYSGVYNCMLRELEVIDHFDSQMTVWCDLLTEHLGQHSIFDVLIYDKRAKKGGTRDLDMLI